MDVKASAVYAKETKSWLCSECCKDFSTKSNCIRHIWLKNSKREKTVFQKTQRKDSVLDTEIRNVKKVLLEDGDENDNTTRILDSQQIYHSHEDLCVSTMHDRTPSPCSDIDDINNLESSED